MPTAPQLQQPRPQQEGNRPPDQERTQDTGAVETYREAVTEKLRATLESGHQVEVARANTISLTDVRPKIADETLKEPELQDAQEVNGLIEHGDYVGATEKAEQARGRTKRSVETFQQERDVFMEVIREFAEQAQDRLFIVMSPPDTIGMQNREVIDGAVADKRAYVVPQGSKERFQQLFQQVYARVASERGTDVQHAEQSLGLFAPNDLFADGNEEIGFTIPLQQDGKDMQRLVFLYGRERGDDGEEGDEERRQATVNGPQSGRATNN